MKKKISISFSIFMAKKHQICKMANYTRFGLKNMFHRRLEYSPTDKKSFKTSKIDLRNTCKIFKTP